MSVSLDSIMQNLGLDSNTVLSSLNFTLLEADQADTGPSSLSIPFATPEENEDPGQPGEQSLQVLAVKLVTLLQNSETGVVDLREAATDLNFRQKRRIYDVTNVLEGVGLIEKKTKNVIEWRGSKGAAASPESAERAANLNQALKDLDEEEVKLDELIRITEQNIELVKETPDFLKWGYVTASDVRRVLPNETVFVVAGPKDVHLHSYSPELLDKERTRKLHRLAIVSPRLAPARVAILLNFEVPDEEKNDDEITVIKDQCIFHILDGPPVNYSGTLTPNERYLSDSWED